MLALTLMVVERVEHLAEVGGHRADAAGGAEAPDAGDGRRELWAVAVAHEAAAVVAVARGLQTESSGVTVAGNLC